MEKVRGRKHLPELEKAKRAVKRAWSKYCIAKKAHSEQTPEHKEMEEVRKSHRGRPPLTLAAIKNKANTEWLKAKDHLRAVEKAEGVDPMSMDEAKVVEDPSVDGNKRVGQPRGDDAAAIDYRIRRLIARRKRILEGAEDGKDDSERERGVKGGLRGRHTLSRDEKIDAIDLDIKNLREMVQALEAKMTKNEREARKLKLMSNKARDMRAEIKSLGLMEQLEYARNNEANVISGADDVAPIVKNTVIFERGMKQQRNLVQMLVKHGKLYPEADGDMPNEARRAMQQATVQQLTDNKRRDKMKRDLEKHIRMLEKDLANL